MQPTSNIVIVCYLRLYVVMLYILIFPCIHSPQMLILSHFLLILYHHHHGLNGWSIKWTKKIQINNKYIYILTYMTTIRWHFLYSDIVLFRITLTLSFIGGVVACCHTSWNRYIVLTVPNCTYCWNFELSLHTAQPLIKYVYCYIYYSVMRYHAKIAVVVSWM